MTIIKYALSALLVSITFLSCNVVLAQNNEQQRCVILLQTATPAQYAQLLKQPGYKNLSKAQVCTKLIERRKTLSSSKPLAKQKIKGLGNNCGDAYLHCIFSGKNIFQCYATWWNCTN